MLIYVKCFLSDTLSTPNYSSEPHNIFLIIDNLLDWSMLFNSNENQIINKYIHTNCGTSLNSLKLDIDSKNIY